ncbi:MAG TPA: hypothetical protein IAB05_06250, partial [Candidatus Stercoripulliclostridium merdigallinarum]|nr:hypothetical protein [Candidatus Stercoripulliclostridium merdigallinarum]
MLQTGKRKFGLASVIVALVLVAAMAVTALAFKGNDTALADDSFAASGSPVVFAHLTDTHY